jgi:hypothetical protein
VYPKEVRGFWKWKFKLGPLTDPHKLEILLFPKLSSELEESFENLMGKLVIDPDCAIGPDVIPNNPPELDVYANQSSKKVASSLLVFRLCFNNRI